MDKYKVAKESNFTRNRFKVSKLKIVTYWGEKGEIPETVTVNLSKNTAWSLGNEIELSTTEEDEAITFEQSETCDTTDEEDETADETVKEEENGTKNRVKITPNINESDTESLAKVRLENNDNGEDTSTLLIQQ